MKPRAGLCEKDLPGVGAPTTGSELCQSHPVSRRMFLKPCRESRPASQEQTSWQPGEEPHSTSGHPWRLLVGLGEWGGEPEPAVVALMDLEREGKTDEHCQDGYCLPPLTNDNG